MSFVWHNARELRAVVKLIARLHHYGVLSRRDALKAGLFVAMRWPYDIELRT